MIIVKNKEALNLFALRELALRHVFEDNLDANEVRQMQESVMNWANKLELDRELVRLDDNEEYMLGLIAKYLKDNESGKLEATKKLYKDKGIDYRKVYNLPGARTADDYANGRQLEEESRRRNGF
jgi:hypothetical protein